MIHMFKQRKIYQKTFNNHYHLYLTAVFWHPNAFLDVQCKNIVVNLITVCVKELTNSDNRMRKRRKHIYFHCTKKRETRLSSFSFASVVPDYQDVFF